MHRKELVRLVFASVAPSLQLLFLSFCSEILETNSCVQDAVQELELSKSAEAKRFRDFINSLNLVCYFTFHGAWFTSRSMYFLSCLSPVFLLAYLSLCFLSLVDRNTAGLCARWNPRSVAKQIDSLRLSSRRFKKPNSRYFTDRSSCMQVTMHSDKRDADFN